VTGLAPVCEETVWSHRGPDDGFARGHLEACTSRARYEAYDPAVPDNGWRRLCGRHANTGRWAGYPDIRWRQL
jgi:hypothetical protein